MLDEVAVDRELEVDVDVCVDEEDMLEELVAVCPNAMRILLGFWMHVGWIEDDGVSRRD